jgi:hypothetical protein
MPIHQTQMHRQREYPPQTQAAGELEVQAIEVAENTVFRELPHR